jgi:predicted HAD superfamily Cof-like phosphohydrolase
MSIVNNLPKSVSALVREFTVSSGFKIPSSPQPFSRAAFERVVIKVLSELAEGASVFTEQPHDFLASCLQKTRTEEPNEEKPATTDEENMERVLDAFADACIYLKNGCWKHGLDLELAERAVAAHNLGKRWPDGTFKRDEFGIVQKPPGFKEFDMHSHILNDQKNNNNNNNSTNDNVPDKGRRYKRTKLDV